MTKAPMGVLLLHGLTSHINCIDPVVPRLQKLKLPYRMPILRGHGTKPSDLEGVRWTDWVEDGQRALDDLLAVCEQVVIVSLSMGSLVALELDLKQPAKIAGLVCLVPALKMKSRRAGLVPVMARFQKNVSFKYDPRNYFDQAQGLSSQNYNGLPTSTLAQFIRFGQQLRKPARLAAIRTPILIIQAAHDRTIDPRIAQFLYNSVSSPDKKLAWFYGTGHEILRDAEREKVLDAIEAFLVRLAAGSKPQNAVS